MSTFNRYCRRTVAAVFMASALGTAVNAAASNFEMDFQGYVTMLGAADGTPIRNPSFGKEPRFHGWRTPISGHMVMTIDQDGLRGSATFDPFLFLNTLASGRDISFVPVSTLLNIPTSTLLVGNMSFDFGTYYKGIPVSIVLDMGNLTMALMQSSPGAIIGGIMKPASDDEVFTNSDGTQKKLPIGPVVVATTKWDTTDVDTNGDGVPGPLGCGTNPSGTVPLVVDTAINETNGETGIGGSPIKACASVGISPNFDISQVTVTCVDLLGIGTCAAVPAMPLSPQPLAPVLNSLAGALP